MTIPPNLVASLVAPHPRDIAKRMLDLSKKKRSERKPAALWAWRAEVSPADLYCYLGARFGRPNGMQNFFRTNTSDNLVHWHWSLSCLDDGHIEIQGMNFRTELWVFGFDVTDADSFEFARQLKDDFVNFGPRMSEIRKELEDWIEFANPYQRLRRAIESLMSDLKSLELRPETDKIPDLPAMVTSQTQPEYWKAIFAKYSKGLGLCFGIRSMLPVLAEAYVNLLLFLLMRPEIRTDERLKENTIRQPIDVRIKSLHLTCVGFERPVDYSHPACKEYHSLVNERNDLLHGNVVLEKLQFNEVYFSGTVPVFKEYRSLWERSVGVDIQAVGLHKLTTEVKTVDALTAYLASCLKPEARGQVDRLADKRDLGLNKKTGRVGILFPDHLVDMHMVKGDGDDSNLAT